MSDRVYVVSYDAMDGRELKGIFSSEEKAIAYVASRAESRYYDIEDWSLDIDIDSSDGKKW